MTTKRMCLMDRKRVSEWHRQEQCNRAEPEIFTARRHHWVLTVTAGRWYLLFALYFSMLTICAVLFVHGIVGRYVSTSTLLRMTPGTLHPNIFIQGWSVPSFGIPGLLSNIFIANSPQVLLSTIYFTYNSLFTSLLLGAEWNSYARGRKGLRVSAHPSGEQRATYFLQLPVRWAVPLMILSAIFDWLCSQSIFLVSIEFDHMITQDTDTSGSLFCTESTECFDRYVTCGYNPLSILTTCILGIVMVVLVVPMSLRRYRMAGMPVAGTCSASISAACHLDATYDSTHSMSTPMGKEAATSRLQWGEMDTPLVPKAASVNIEEVLSNEMNSEATRNQEQHILHCGFPHQEVTAPGIGWLSAG